MTSSSLPPQTRHGVVGRLKDHEDPPDKSIGFQLLFSFPHIYLIPRYRASTHSFVSLPLSSKAIDYQLFSAAGAITHNCSRT